MDPVHALATRRSGHTAPAAEDIDAFYDAHAFAALHEVRRALRRLLRRKAPPAPAVAPVIAPVVAPVSGQA